MATFVKWIVYKNEKCKIVSPPILRHLSLSKNNLVLSCISSFNVLLSLTSDLVTPSSTLLIILPISSSSCCAFFTSAGLILSRPSTIRPLVLWSNLEAAIAFMDILHVSSNICCVPTLATRASNVLRETSSEHNSVYFSISSGRRLRQSASLLIIPGR